MKIRVKATARVLGLKAGEIAEVDTSPYVDMLVNHGWLVWLNRPVDAPVVTLPPAAERPNAPTRGRTTRSVTVVESPEDTAPDPVAMICPECEWTITDNVPDRKCSLCSASMIYDES